MEVRWWRTRETRWAGRVSPPLVGGPKSRLAILGRGSVLLAKLGTPPRNAKAFRPSHKGRSAARPNRPGNSLTLRRHEGRQTRLHGRGLFANVAGQKTRGRTGVATTSIEK